MKEKKTLNNRLLAIFLLIGAVLIAELSWWVILVQRSSDEAVESTKSYLVRAEHVANKYYTNATDKTVAKEDIARLYHGLYFDGEKFHVSHKFIAALNEKGHRKKRMFIMETSVFFLAIFLGFLLVYRSLRQEFKYHKQQQNFMLSITHELKTPLASIKLYLQTLKRVDNPEKRDTFIGNSIFEVDRLNRLIENILYSVRLEGNPNIFSEKTYPVKPSLEQILHKFDSAEHVTIHTDLDASISHRINPDFLSILVNNLVGNAIKYNKDRVDIFVSLKKDGQHLHLDIKDTGVGIPEEERKFVFQRFYRVGSEETREAKGTGLGLYIVKRIVDLCHGTIECLANEPRGVRFKIVLPQDIG